MAAFAELVDCDTSDNAAMMSCLRSKPYNVLNDTINDFTNNIATRPLILAPTVDHDFVEEKPVDIFNQNVDIGKKSRDTLASFDLMIGANEGEGYLLTPPSPWDKEGREKFLPNSTFFKDTLIPQFQEIFLGNTCPALSEAIVAEYTDLNDAENPENIREQYIKLAGDVFFVEPACHTADLHAGFSERQSSYLYLLTINPSNHALPTPSWANKPNHGDDMTYVFGGEGDISEFGVPEYPSLEDWEREASRNIMTLWTNFAKTGNPNKPRDLGVDWLPYSQKHRHYFDIASTMSPSNVKTRLDDRMVNFWGKVVPAISKACSSESSIEGEGTCSKKENCSP